MRMSLPQHRRFAQAALLAATLALAAVPVRGAVAADSVERFKELLKPTMNDVTLSYAQAKATGPRSLELVKVVLTPVPKPDAPHEEPVNIERVVIEDIDFDGIARGDAPWRLAAHLIGIGIGGNSAIPPEVALVLGPGPYKANLDIDYRVTDGKALEIRDLALEFPGFGKLRLALALDGIEPNGPNITGAKMDNVAMRSGALTYEDASLLGKMVAASAKEASESEEAVAGEWAGMLSMLAAKQGDGGTPLVNAILALLKDYRAPKGPLQITFAPSAADGAAHPVTEALTAGVVKTLGASATYAGKTYDAAP